MHLLGAHCIGNGGIHMAARRAGRAGMKSLQIFTAVPKYYNDKVGVKAERVARFVEALGESSIDLKNVIVHAGYVLNCATPEPEKWERAAAGLAKELERSTSLGVGGVCFHPGAATDGDVASGLARVSVAMIRALETVPLGTTKLLIENTAGAGTTLGRTPSEIAAMLSGIPSELRRRVGYGLDTCHLFASGYDISASREVLTAVLDDFENVTGEAPSFLHLNDSEGSMGSNRDRHALVGQGKIGVEPFGWLLKDRRSQGVPLILETPQANPDIADEDDTPDPWDVESLGKLQSMTNGIS